MAYYHIFKHIFLSEDRSIFEPAFETIIQLIASDRSMAGYLYKTYFPILLESEDMSGFAKSMIEAIIRAESMRVYLFDTDGPNVNSREYLLGLKEILKRLLNKSNLLWREMEAYAESFLETDRNLSVHLLEVMSECGNNRNNLTVTQRIIFDPNPAPAVVKLSTSSSTEKSIQSAA